MAYMALELLGGLALVHGVVHYFMPSGSVVVVVERSFPVGAAVGLAAAFACAIGCRMPLLRRSGGGVAAFCALATLASLVVSAKALAAGLLICA